MTQFIAVGKNSLKDNSYPAEKNKEWIENIFKGITKAVISYSGLTVDLCNKYESNFIIRGVRDEKDFEFEKKVTQNNRKLNSKGKPS